MEKDVLHFIGEDKALVLNPTNAKALAQVLGDDSDGWGGAHAVLHVEEATIPWIKIRIRIPVQVDKAERQAPREANPPPHTAEDLGQHPLLMKLISAMRGDHLAWRALCQSSAQWTSRAFFLLTVTMSCRRVKRRSRPPELSDERYSSLRSTARHQPSLRAAWNNGYILSERTQWNEDEHARLHARPQTLP